MAKAGLDPKSIKTVDDVYAFLDQLKAYVDSNPDLDFVLDTGWLAGAWGRFNPEVWAFGLGATKQEISDLYLGKISWTDQEKNPFVPFFKTLKDFYDRGYMPERWWTRAWDQDYEAQVISAAKKHNKSLGRLSHQVDEGEALYKKGYDFIAFSNDLRFLETSLKSGCDALRQRCRT